jgi:SAM-dependent methyltransferase
VDTVEYDKMYAVEDRHFWFCGKRAWIAALLRRHLGEKVSGEILDVGCGTGANLLFLSAWGETLGVEKHPLALQYCQRRGLGNRVTPGSVNQLPFADQRFSLVCALDVLYHREVHPQDALNEMHRVLKPQGYLLITDSALPFLTGPHDRAVWARERFTRHALTALVKQAGFGLCQISYADFFLFPLVASLRVYERLRAKKGSSISTKLPPANRSLLKVLQFEAKMLARGVNLPWGSSIICLAQRR